MLKFSKLEMRYFDLKIFRPRVTREISRHDSWCLY